MVRGGAAAPLAQVLAALLPAARIAAGLGPWALTSRAPSRTAGTVVVADAITDIPAGGFLQPTVLVVRSMGGQEDMPMVSIFLDTGSWWL